MSTRARARGDESASRAGRSPRRRLLKVAVAGAAGRMGREVLGAVQSAGDLVLVGAVSRGFAGSTGSRDLPLESELAARGVATFGDAGPCLVRTCPDIIIEFTSAAGGPGIIRAALEAGVDVVSGTTGIPEGEIEALEALAEKMGRGLIVVPNFSLGATVLAILARTAAPYFSAAEIVELHHDQKRDAPSGTALALARVVGAGLAGASDAEGGKTGASGAEGGKMGAPGAEDGVQFRGEAGPRGLVVHRVPIHSVRLSGLVAHHELIFASSGETLTLRHDSISRTSFMPGVLLAARNAGKVKGLVTSLEQLLRLARPDATGV